MFLQSVGSYSNEPSYTSAPSTSKRVFLEGFCKQEPRAARVMLLGAGETVWPGLLHPRQDRKMLGIPLEGWAVKQLVCPHSYGFLLIGACNQIPGTVTAQGFVKTPLTINTSIQLQKSVGEKGTRAIDPPEDRIESCCLSDHCWSAGDGWSMV